MPSVVTDLCTQLHCSEKDGNEDDDDYEYMYTQFRTGPKWHRIVYITVIVINILLLFLFVLIKSPIGQKLWKQESRVTPQIDDLSEKVMSTFKLCMACDHYNVAHLTSHKKNTNVCCFDELADLLSFFKEEVNNAINKSKYYDPNKSLTQSLNKSVGHLELHDQHSICSGEQNLKFVKDSHNPGKTVLQEITIQSNQKELILPKDGTYFIYTQISNKLEENISVKIFRGDNLLLQTSGNNDLKLEGVFKLKTNDSIKLSVSCNAQNIFYYNESYFGIFMV